MAAFPPLPFKVKALAPYVPTSATELALVVGQIYEVTQTDGKGVWVQSSVNGVIGWFPFNYTELVPSGPPSAAPPAASSPRTELKSSDAKVKKDGSSTALKKKPKKEKRNIPKKPGPPLRTHVEKNKKNLPITVTIQSTPHFCPLTRPTSCTWEASSASKRLVHPRKFFGASRHPPSPPTLHIPAHKILTLVPTLPFAPF